MVLVSEEAIREGARKVLQRSIGLSEGESVCIVFDEVTADAARFLAEEARQLGIRVLERYVPTREQRQISSADPVSLPLEDQDALAEARGILTCLSSDISCTPYRKRLLDEGTERNKRLGHMPGVDVALLANAANIDYAAAIQRCDDLALAMTLGESARVTSFVLGPNNEAIDEVDLHIGLGGLRRSPITSTGIIPLGTWGNLPGGETFIAPMEGSADGEFILNGAFTDHVLAPGDYVRLRFASGKLIDFDGEGAGRGRFAALVEYAASKDPTGYSGLAELGIGVNPGIVELTGNALFDEKCAGTAHVAIGDSTRYGGEHESQIHEDLVTRLPTIEIDGRRILERGRDRFDAADWRDSLAPPWTTAAPESNRLVSRSGIEAGTDGRGFLFARRVVAAGRICTYTIGEHSSSARLASLYEELAPAGQPETTGQLLERLSRRLEASQGEALDALQILARHGLTWTGEEG